MRVDAGFLRDRRRLGLWVTAVGFLVSIISLHWDAWYHVFVGRDSFWILPHVAVYSGIAIAAAGAAIRGSAGDGSILRNGIDALKRRDEAVGGVLASVLILGASGVLDDWWHRMFGPEEGLAQLYSPPHWGLFLGFLVMGISAVRAARKDGPTMLRAEALVWFALLCGSTFWLFPFDPLRNPQSGAPVGVLLASWVAFLFVPAFFLAAASSRFGPGFVLGMAVGNTLMRLFALWDPLLFAVGVVPALLMERALSGGMLQRNWQRAVAYAGLALALYTVVGAADPVPGLLLAATALGCAAALAGAIVGARWPFGQLRRPVDGASGPAHSS
jgi:hypothetical protein